MMPAIRKAFDFMGDDIVELSTENDALKNKTGAFDENWLEESKANLLKQVDNEKRAILIMSGMQKQMGQNFKKWHIFLRGLWESDFVNIVFKRNKVQDLNINQLKLEVHDSYKKDEKITTNFEAVNDEDVVNKGYLDEKLGKINGVLSLLEKDYNEFEFECNKQSLEDFLIREL